MSRRVTIGTVVELFLDDPKLLDTADIQLPTDDKRAFFVSLSLAFKERFNDTGSNDDLEHTVSANKKALELTPTDHPYYAGVITNLSIALMSRFQHLGSIDDLDEAVAMGERAVASTSTDPSNHPALLNNLADVLQTRYERFGKIDDLNRAITMNEQAVQLTPPNHDDRAKYLNNLAVASWNRFERLREREDLTRTIESSEQAVQLTPTGHPELAPMLSNLGLAFQSQFQLSDSIADISHTIVLIDKAVRLTPTTHNNKSIFLNGLAHASQLRFDRTGSIADLDRAIESAEQAVLLTPAKNVTLAMNLNTLSNALQTRFERVGSLEDLDRAVEVSEKAVESTPHGHPDCATNSNSLARALHLRFDRKKSFNDLDRAIKVREDFMEQIPLDHPYRAQYICNVGTAFQCRYEEKLSNDDVTRAIAMIEEAMKLEQNQHNLASVHHNLGVTLKSQFKQTGGLETLDRAITEMERAVSLTPSDHPDLALHMKTLGDAVNSRFQKTGSNDDLQRAIEMTERAVAVVTAPPALRIQAADAASRLLLGRDHNRAQPLLRTAVELLPIVGSRTLMPSDRQYNVSQFGGITARAASVSLQCGQDPHQALQLLEVGRGVLASLQLEVRSDVTTLEVSHPELAQQFKDIRDQLDVQQNKLMTTRIDSISDANLRRLLSKQFDDNIRTIRNLQGFGRFLLGPSEDELKTLAQDGPIIVFNISEVRSDALLVEAHQIRSLQLPLLTHTSVETYSNRFLNAVRPTGIKSRSKATAELNRVLEWLWDAAVGPILDELGFTEPPSRDDKWPRVWWVGSGRLSLLPIHAAGYHGAGSTKTAIDRVISSYIPTMKSLAYAREKLDRAAKLTVQKTVLIGMPTTPGHGDLVFVKDEIKQLKGLLPSCTVMENPTKAGVLPVLLDHQIAHFSCHGYSSATDPSQSRLLLNDWRTDPLIVSDITAINIQRPQLAFLSACHSARVRDLSLLDESINLSTAFLLAGYPSVIGSLWHVTPDESSAVAKDVYTSMLVGEGRLDTCLSAQSLHRAIHILRQKSSVIPGLTEKVPNPLAWASYIHLGL